PLRRSEFLLDSLFMNSRLFSMERPLVEEDPFPDRRGFTECLPVVKGNSTYNLLRLLVGQTPTLPFYPSADSIFRRRLPQCSMK
ncbi:MAG: hypothetical protein L3J03_09175, partial [Desulfobacterales bacterium]|nr:hypothetical protein [Desulfobacterales bacterium]